MLDASIKILALFELDAVGNDRNLACFAYWLRRTTARVDALDLIFEQKDRGKTLSVLIYNIYMYVFIF